MALFARWLLLACAVWMQSAQAVPTLDLRSQDTASIQIDLRNHWQSALVDASGKDPAQPYDPAAVWAWPDAGFATGRASAVDLPPGARLVGRLSVEVPSGRNDMVLEIPMPWLNVAHLSYRYKDEPWVYMVAGDRVPMRLWPFVNRQPAFAIDPKLGQLQIVLELESNGVVAAPVWLRDDPGFRLERFTSSLVTGALLGLTVVLCLVGLGAATLFKRGGFVAVAAMSFTLGFAVFCQSGVAGMYIALDSPWFNDVGKFVTAMVATAVIPWTVAVVVSQKFYSRLIYRFVVAWLVLGLVVGAAMVALDLRDIQSTLAPAFALVSSLLALAIAGASLARKQPHALWTLIGVLFYSLGIVSPMGAYLGFVGTGLGFVLSGVGIMLSVLLLLFSLLLQYRQGRMVMSRAAMSNNRDMLTGLYNLRGFNQTMVRTVQRLETDSTMAVFFYVQLASAEKLKLRYGDEGFEMGLVQIAAALSSSVGINDNVGRISDSCFAVTALMPRNPELANRIATRMLTRIMGLARHVAPLAQTVRIAVAWMPTYGTTMPELSERCQRALRRLPAEKRIAWVGGSQARADAKPSEISSLTPSTRSAALAPEELLPSIPGILASERETVMPSR